MKKCSIISLLFLLFHSGVALAQQTGTDTVSITIEKAEQQFINNNLQILAQRYNIDATKALIIQARLYPNPNINISQGAYNTQTGKWFQTNYTDGEVSYQVSQLIVLSHKIKKGV